MVTWEQIIALPEYQQASPEKKEKAKQAYLSLMKSKAEKGNRDILGGSVVTSGVEKANEQRKQEAEVQRKARAQMGNMRARGVRVPEEEPLRTPVYDPVDLAVDAATGFMGSAGKAALRAGAKALAKNVAREVGTGAVAGAGMVAADKMGAGALGQLAAGLGGGVVGGAALTGGRRLIASLVKRGIPESQAARIVGDMTPEAVEKAVKAIEPTPGRIGKQTPVKRIGIAQAADAAKVADDVTLHPEAEDYADMMADYTPKQGRQAIPPVEAQGAKAQAVTEKYRYAKAPKEGPFAVEDNPKPVDRPMPERAPTTDELLEAQRMDFAPEEAVPQRGSIDYDERIGQRVIPLPAGVKHLPEGVTRGRDGKLYLTISNSPRGKVRVAQEAIQAVPEVAVKPEPVAPVTEYPTLTRHTKGEIEQLIEEETDKLVSEIPRLPRHRAKEIAGARLVMRYGDEFDRLRKAIRGGDHRPEILALDEGATFSPHNINEQVVDLTGTRTLLIDQDVTNEQLAKQFEHGDAIPDVKETPYYMGQYFPEPYRASSVKFKDSDGIPVTVNATFHGDIGIHKSFSGDGYTVRVGDDIIADGISRRKATDVARDFWTKHINPDLAPKAPTGVAPSVPKALPKAPAVEAPKVEAPARKQPWEMTGDDFATLHLWADAHPSKIKELGLGDWDKEALDLQVRGLANGDSILEDDLSRAFWTDPRERDAAHRVFVKKALSAGKPVPPEVLAEYPDLAPKQGIAPPVPKADVPVELPKVGAGPTVFNTNTTYSMGPKEYTYPKWLPNKLNSFNEQNIPAVTENISIYTPEGIYTVMPGGSSRLQDFSEEQFAKVLSRYSDPDEISVPHNKAFRDLVANRKSEIDNAFEQHFAERGITVGGKKAKKGVAPSVPKAAMSDPGNLGIVAPGTMDNRVKLSDFAQKHMEFEPPRKGFIQSLKDKAKGLYTGLHDETAPITLAVRKHAGKDAYKQVDLAIGQTRGTSAKVEERVNELFDTVKSYLRSEQEYADWETYRIAKRMEALHDAKKGVRTEELADAQQAIAEISQRYGPEGVKRFDDLSGVVRRDFDGQILDMMHDIGQVSDEWYTAIKNSPESKAYAAFQRILDAEAESMGIPKVAMPGASVKAYKGGHQKVTPTLDATMVNMARAYRMVEQMKVNNLIVDLRQASPGLQELVKPVGKVDGPKPPNSFFTYDNGHKVYWNVPADIAEAMQFFGSKPIWEISKWASPATRMLRVGATLNPEFMFGRNPIKDIQTSAYVVGTPPVVGFLEGLSHVVKSKIGTDEVIRELIKDGGGNASMFALDREAVAGARARNLSWDSPKTKMLKHPIQFLRAMMELAEQSQRVGNYLYLKRQGKSGAEAAVEGARRGTLDFAHFGKHGRSLNGLIAFFNAAMQEQVQVTKKLLLGGKDSGKVWLRGALYGTAPSIALWYINKDNPRYQELPSYRKYGFWNIVTPKVIISLPRPFALGLIFAGAPEAALNVAYRKDPNAISEWAKTFAETFFPDLIPTAAKPIVEVATNKNFFTGGTVVPRSVEGLPDEMQVTPTTSKTAETLGRYLHYSPAKIDHLIRGYTAGLGKTAVGIADKWLGDDKVMPAKTMAERIPVVKGLVAKEPVGYGSASVEAFYKLWEGMEKNYRGLKALYEQGDRQGLQKRVRANPNLVRYYEDAKEIRKFLSSTRKDLQEVQASKELTPEQKRMLLDRIGKAMTTVTRNFLKAYYAKE